MLDIRQQPAPPAGRRRFALRDKRSLANACPKGRTPTLPSRSLRVTTSAGRDRRGTRSPPVPRVREAGVRPAEAIAAELRSASAPDLAMLVVAGRQLRQALG